MSSVSVVQLACPVCTKLMQIPSSAAGKVARCPTCQSRLKIAPDLQQLSLVQAIPTQSPPTAAPPAANQTVPAPTDKLPSFDTSDTSKSSIKGRKRKKPKPTDEVNEEVVVEREPISSKRKILWGVVGLTATIVVCLLAFLIYRMVRTDPQIELNYAPDNCYAMIRIDNNALANSEYHDSLEAEMPQLHEQFIKNFKKTIGTDSSNVNEIYCFFGISNKQSVPVFVFKLEEPLDESEMPWNLNPKNYIKKKYGKKHRYYQKESQPPMSLHIANEYTIVYGSDEMLYQAFWRERRAEFNSRFKKLFEEADFSKPIVGLIDFKGFAKTKTHKKRSSTIKIPGVKRPGVPEFNDLAFLKSGSMSVSLDSDFNFTASILCKSDDDATALREKIQSYLNFGAAISHRITGGSLPEIRKFKIFDYEMSLVIEVTLRCKSEKEAKALEKKFNYFIYRYKKKLDSQKKIVALVSASSVEVNKKTVKVELWIDSDEEEYRQKLEGRIEELRYVIKSLLTSSSDHKAAADSIEFKQEGAKLDIALKMSPTDSALLLKGIFMPSGKKASKRQPFDLDDDKEKDDKDDAEKTSDGDP